MNLQPIDVLLQQIRIDHHGFMSQELRAFAETIRETFLSETFQFLPFILWQCVPEFRFPMMEVVYAIQVQILLMPSEHCLPGTYVQIRDIHSRNDSRQAF